MRPLTALLLAAIVYIAFIGFHWRIINKAGLNKWLILLFVIPQLAILGWGVLAFVDWPPKPSGRVKVYGRK